MNANDNINMEYEARVMLTQEQYLAMKKAYLAKYPKARKIININYYFDTPELALTMSQKVLRVRVINDVEKELTLKIQQEEGCLEINHILSSKEEDKLFKNSIIEYPPILDELKKAGIDLSTIKLITDLKTERIEIEIEDYLFVLDKNYYRNKIDYNLEIESNSKLSAKSHIFSIISPFGVTYKKDYISKSKRAIYNL